MTETRTRILDTAELLFAEGGEDATSAREITRRAGVNVAAVNYHFGGREGLLESVLDRILGPLNARRLDLLDELDDDASLHDVVECFVRPDVELLEEIVEQGRTPLARTMGAAYTAPSPTIAGFLDRQFAPIASAFRPEFARRVAVPVEELDVRLDLAVSMVTGVFARLSDDGHPLGAGDVEVRTARLADAVAAVLSAPTTVPSAGMPANAPRARPS